jgi:proteasome lid subunit RPN8/RPN11
VRISQRLIDELIAHAREEAPNECCGMIGGVDDTARTIYRGRNEFASPLRYKVHSDDVYRFTEQEIPARGEDLLAIYHSHTKTPAYPSQTDVNEAAVGWPDPMYVIVSLANPDALDVKGYWLRDKKIADAELVVE